MTSEILRVSVDSKDPYGQSLWWAKVIGYTEDPTNRNYPEDPCGLLITTGDGLPALVFERERPSDSERIRPTEMHLDIKPTDCTQAEEVQRLQDMGATILEDHRDNEGREGWVVMADLEGNNFCVLRSEQDKAEWVEKLDKLGIKPRNEAVGDQ
ncbi:VOC family protein [Psychromicrobium lacuslunae]|uniref:VOC family protein n=1 Tax=Psychromicrobium lacuslunae TaxID=1618207 RepID=UPI0005D3ED70|nr:VOC family protein [Psychromicrobium lacuslunae]